MVTYKNISVSAKTFYGVKFEPGDVKEVPGYINSPSMIRIFGIKPTPEDKEPTYKAPRGRKPKSSEPEKGLFAEITETQINQSEEETSNGN